MRGSGALAPVAVAPFLHHRIPSHPTTTTATMFSTLSSSNNISRRTTTTTNTVLVFVNKNEASSTTTSPLLPDQEEICTDEEALQYVSQIRTILDRLKKNRDMLFNEVKLTVMIEDPRDVERRRLLGIDDENAPTRDELADALVQVNEGKIPEDRVALRMLAEEMAQWPNLEVEPPKKKKGKSLYARFTDTGVDPQEAAKRLNIDWDSAAEIEEAAKDDMDVPPVLGYGALYLVSAFPVIIGISVVLILFYNSLQ